MKYLNVKTLSKKWNISERSIRNYCQRGRIPDAYLNGKTWWIPENATKPERINKTKNVSKSLLDVLLEEKEHHIKGSIYQKLQIEFAFNSNHIEGSQLTHDQTRYIYETKTIGLTNSPVKVDDIIETINHFKCIDFVIDHAKHKLNESFIKHLHFLLKQNTTEQTLSWFKVGDYKLLPNEIGDNATSSPINVSEDINKLLNEYNSNSKVTVEDIIDFHYRFEKIHPFQDGNGRVGRLILLKECLKHNIIPILIKDEFKEFYYRGLDEYEITKGYLLDTCLHGQDIFKDYLDYFQIKYKK